VHLYKQFTRPQIWALKIYAKKAWIATKANSRQYSVNAKKWHKNVKMDNWHFISVNLFTHCTFCVKGAQRLMQYLHTLHKSGTNVYAICVNLTNACVLCVKWTQRQYAIWKDFTTHCSFSDMPENGHCGHFQAFSGMLPMVAKGCQGSPRVSKVQGGPQGWLRWVRTKLIIFKSLSNMIFKIGPFPHWNSH